MRSDSSSRPLSRAVASPGPGSLGGAGVLQSTRGGARSGGWMSTLAASPGHKKKEGAFRLSGRERRQGPVRASWPPLGAAVNFPGKQERKCSWGEKGGGWEAVRAQLSPFSKARDPCGPGLGSEPIWASLPGGASARCAPSAGFQRLTQGAGCWAPTGGPAGERGCLARLQLTASNLKDFCFLCLRFS